MVNPSKVGKVLTCQRNESCYVKRKTVVSSNSTTNSTGIWTEKLILTCPLFLNWYSHFIYTETKITVKRGCRAASSSDDQNVITRYLLVIRTFSRELNKLLLFFFHFRTNSTLGMSCRLSDFCNSFDANRLVRSNSASGMIFLHRIIYLALCFKYWALLFLQEIMQHSRHWF